MAGSMAFARERSSEMPCTRKRRRNSMHRVRFAIVTALVVLGSLAPWSAGAAPPHAGTAAPTPDAAPININTADVKELMKLEGVGRRVAEKIVEYRDTHGPFKKPGRSEERRVGKECR